MDNSTALIVRQLAAVSPTVLVCFVGMILALVFIKKYTSAAVMTLIATFILAGTAVGVTLVQLQLARMFPVYGWSVAQYSQAMTAVSISGSVLRALGLALLLVAVFVGRKGKTNIPISA